MSSNKTRREQNPDSFDGFPPSGLDFLRRLKRHNTREWFAERKHVYEEQVRLPMLRLVADLTSEMWDYAPEHTIEPSRAVYRIQRDTRFSEDKSPYKTHIAAIFPHRRLPKNAGASFYFNVSPDGAEVAAGVYAPESAELRLIRQRLLTEYGRLGEIVRRIEGGSPLVGELRGEMLRRGPRGFPASHPAEELLRRKAFYYELRLPPGLLTSRRLFDELSGHFRLLAPLVAFLDGCLIQQPPDDPRRSAGP
ncbi:MAG TPA: DUF2461 domain-containing protein [Pyrinomonadaceae bacterium]|nr:DUF2461 domain-containing protein [Pyrinomonadaceae bacterium]